MAKKKPELKELVVIIPLHRGFQRTKEVDGMAYEAGRKLSTVPLKKFKFVSRKPSTIHPFADNLEYRAWGIPKEEDDASTD